MKPALQPVRPRLRRTTSVYDATSWGAASLQGVAETDRVEGENRGRREENPEDPSVANDNSGGEPAAGGDTDAGGSHAARRKGFAAQGSEEELRIQEDPEETQAPRIVADPG